MGGVPGTFSRRKESRAPVPRYLCEIAREARTFGATPGVPRWPVNQRGYGLHRGVPGLTLCRYRRSDCASRPAQCHTGQPSRQNVPVRLCRFGSRPPACHRRGRSSSIILRATTPMGRRWTAGGGPEGRCTLKPRRWRPHTGIMSPRAERPPRSRSRRVPRKTEAVLREKRAPEPVGTFRLVRGLTRSR